MEFKSKIKESISNEDQKIFVKFALLQDHSAGLIHATLTKLLGSLAVSKSTVKKWASKLKKGEPIKSFNFGGDRSDATFRQERIEQIESCFDESRHWSSRSLATKTGIPRATVQRIVKEELKMTKKLGKYVPHKLTADQQDHRILCARMNLATHNKTKSHLTYTLSVDETWLSLYMEPDRNQQRQYLREGEEAEPVVRQNIHEHKRMLIMAMDFDGIAFYELLPEKQTVTAEVYLQFLKRNLEKWQKGKKGTQVWLHHDNARPHKAKIVKEFLQCKGISTWEQPGYSPDISPLDFCCFGQLKRRLKGIEHTSWNELETNLKKVVNDLNNEGKMSGVADLPSRWQRVIDSEGQYI